MEESSTNENTGRMPDFILIGTMKSATTTLFRWLGSVPDVELPSNKEPGFFADEQAWARGIDWYRGLFANIPKSVTTGEASVIYADPYYAGVAATRIVEVLPQVKLVCILRDPVERLRSHYRHEVQRGRESRSFLDAISDPASSYIRRSEYHAALRPYFDYFDSEQLMVVSMAATVTPPFTGWYSVLAHLNVGAVPPSGEAANVTSGKPRFSRLALRLWDRGVLDRAASVSPPWIRRLGRQLLLHDTHEYRALLASADTPAPAHVLDHLSDEVRLLEDVLGRSMGFSPQ